MMSWIQRAAAVLIVAMIGVSMAPVIEADGENKIWNGLFSTEQVARGKDAFEGNCARCHQATLAGSDRGPALKGDNFWNHWENETLVTLFTKVRDQMPPNLTGNQLEPQTKLDIVTYILHSNGLPTGSAELKTDSATLDEVQILQKDAVPSVPNFALVRVVGCLSQDAHAWVLINGSRPTTITQPLASAGEEPEAGTPLGDERFLLTSIGGFKPEPQNGKKVEARGLIYKAPGDSRIDLTSLQVVAPSCSH